MYQRIFYMIITGVTKKTYKMVELKINQQNQIEDSQKLQ